MKILIVPKIIKRYKNQLEYSVEYKLIYFLKQIYKSCNLEIMSDARIKGKFSLIVISGGNNITKFSKSIEDKTRKKLDNAAINFAKKNKIRILGICHGAHFLAMKSKATFRIDKRHVATNHKIYLECGNEIVVNSFHKIKIIKLNSNFQILAKAEDNSIEAFKDPDKNIGIIWHPERAMESKRKNKIIKKILCS